MMPIDRGWFTAFFCLLIDEFKHANRNIVRRACNSNLFVPMANYSTHAVSDIRHLSVVLLNFLSEIVIEFLADRYKEKRMLNLDPQPEQFIQHLASYHPHRACLAITSCRMFSRTTTSVLAIILFFIAVVAGSPMPTVATDGNCNTGAIQCCQQTQVVRRYRWLI